jgi:hypothetical protein
MEKPNNMDIAEFSVEDKLSKISDTLSAISSSLEGLNELGIILLQPRIISTLSSIFPSPKHLRAYLLSDGLRSSRDIGKIIKVSHTTIKNWWNKWNNEFQIVTQDAKTGTFGKKYSIGDLLIIFGVENTEPKEIEDENK